MPTAPNLLSDGCPVNRASGGVVQRPWVSVRASTRFFHLVDAIARAHEPTPTQLAALERSYTSTGEFLATCPELNGLLEQIHAHGSRRLGTIVRPRDGTREGFDIDLIARLTPGAKKKYSGDQGPTLLLDHLHKALSRYADAHRLKLHRWERCATLEYAEGMCADIAPVIDSPMLAAPYGDTHGLIPDRALRLFDSTNPRGYAKHFDVTASISPNFATTVVFDSIDAAKRADVAPLPDAQEVFDRLLCRLVQLLKVHRNVAFGAVNAGDDMAPTSVFLTTLAAMAYAIEAPKPHAGPLDLLLDIVELMPHLFERIPTSHGSEEWILPNPSAQHENLAASMNTGARQKAFSAWHERIVGDLRRIVHAIENREGMDVLMKALQVAFGIRSANAVQQLEAQRQESRRGAGRVLLHAPLAVAPLSVSARPHTYFGH